MHEILSDFSGGVVAHSFSQKPLTVSSFGLADPRLKHISIQMHMLQNLRGGMLIFVRARVLDGVESWYT